jgi:hypothetical protein
MLKAAKEHLMARTATVIDITDFPELRRLVEAARATGTLSVLQFDDQDVAVLTPIHPEEPRDWTAADDAAASAFRSAAGGLRGLVDGEQLKRHLKAARRSDRPAIVFDE